MELLEAHVTHLFPAFDPLTDNVVQVYRVTEVDAAISALQARIGLLEAQLDEREDHLKDCLDRLASAE